MKQFTILVIEDVPAIMTVVQSTLKDEWYHLIYAFTAETGLRLGIDLSSPIDLLLVNVILDHQILGSDIATQIKAVRPDMRVILLDGKDCGSLAVLAKGWQVLEKPHVERDLLARVRAELGGIGSAGAGG